MSDTMRTTIVSSVAKNNRLAELAALYHGEVGIKPTISETVHRAVENELRRMRRRAKK